VSRIFTTSVASVYPLYVKKVEKKGRTSDELDQVIRWLTGFDEPALRRHLAAGTTFENFFGEGRLNPNAGLITGAVCGVRVEAVDDPLMQKIRYLGKLVDELAKGRPMDRSCGPDRAVPGLRSGPISRWVSSSNRRRGLMSQESSVTRT
jgi:hypothetical protein